VGSGPAGLAAAWILAGQGVRVTIYEAQQVAGGMLAWAIPPFRLPREALEEDIAYVLNHGVDLKLNTCLEPEEVLGLRRENSAVILACGSPRAKEIDLPGSDIPHVWLGLDFLRQAALGSLSEIKGPVVVIGGGNVAMDAARWCLRLTEDVTLAYRRDRQQMTAYAEEVEAAIGEGLKLVFRVQPATIESGDDSRPAFVQFLETAPAEMDEDGRRNFAPIAGREKSLLAKTVILALGQKSEAGIWATGLGLEAITPNPQGLITTGLYAAGDLVTGPATVVEAMAGGIACARHILQGVAS
jgi:heterodisulfide reductase subunit A